MKVLLCLLFYILCGCTSYAQKSYNVLDWKSNTTLYNYIIQRLHQQYVQRDSTLAKAFCNKALPLYQKDCRERYFKILGTMPEKSPLHAEVTGRIQQNGYRIEKVIYESFPHHHVTADLYIPDGKGPFPGVLFFCGHEATAKATITYQQTAILFVKHGFVVLVIDLVSQGERYQFTDSSGNPLARGGTTGHTLLASNSNLVGTSVVSYQLWDNERGLDYLCSLKFVDTARLGCLGNSGGGTQTTYFIPYDPRIKVAAVCSYVTRRERTLELLGPQDGCQWLPDESKAGLDISDYLIMFAPKPVLILAGRYGFVDFNGTLDVYRELKKVYRQLHQPEKVKLFAYDDGHGIQIPKQEVAVQWFRRWLYNDNSSIKENNLNTLSEKELNATKTGQVNTAFKNEVDIQTRNLSLANKWQKQRSNLLTQSTRESYQRMLEKFLNIHITNSIVDTQEIGSFTKDGYHFNKLILRRRNQPPLPCLLAYQSKNKRNDTLIIWLSEEGKEAIARNDSLLNEYNKRGYALLVVDLRGMGETEDNPAFNDKKYYNKEYRDAMLSLFIGKPLPGQRAEDVFTLLDYCKSDKYLKQSFIQINASGTAAEAALLAATLDNRINKVQLYHTIHSFYELLNHPLMKNQYSYVIPDALQYFDLTDLVKFTGKDKVQYVN